MAIGEVAGSTVSTAFSSTQLKSTKRSAESQATPEGASNTDTAQSVTADPPSGESSNEPSGDQPRGTLSIPFTVDVAVTTEDRIAGLLDVDFRFFGEPGQTERFIGVDAGGKIYYQGEGLFTDPSNGFLTALTGIFSLALQCPAAEEDG